MIGRRGGGSKNREAGLEDRERRKWKRV